MHEFSKQNLLRYTKISISICIRIKPADGMPALPRSHDSISSRLIWCIMSYMTYREMQQQAKIA